MTLDLGLRLSYFPQDRELNSNFNIFRPELYDPAKAVRLYAPVLVGTQRRAVDPANRQATLSNTNTLPGNFIGTIVPNSGDIANGFVSSDKAANDRGAQIGPRLGFAYDLFGDGNSVVRGGFGISYDRAPGQQSFDLVPQPPRILTPRLQNGRLDQIATSNTILAPPNIYTLDQSGKITNVYSYSLSIQRNIGLQTVADVAYVGTMGRHLPQLRNINAIPYLTTFQRSAQDSSRFTGDIVPIDEGSSLPTAYRQAGFGFSGVNALPAEFLRPYQGYGVININEPVGSSNYNSLQVSLNRRFRSSLTFGVAYTFSKVFTTASEYGGVTHPFNTRAYDYQLADFDRTHLFVFNYVYSTPKLSRYVGDNVFTRAILDNFQISGITRFSSGEPLELGLNIEGINAGQRITGSYDVAPRFRLQGDSQPNGGGLQQIDPNAFVVPNIGDIEPYPRTYLRGPGINNHDISVFKNFPFSSEGRRYLQLRLEMFNVFNNTQFASLNLGTQLTTAAGATGNNIFTDFGSLSVSNNLRPTDTANQSSQAALGTFFGETNSARSPRVVQLGVKLYF